MAAARCGAGESLLEQVSRADAVMTSRARVPARVTAAAVGVATAGAALALLAVQDRGTAAQVQGLQRGPSLPRAVTGFPRGLVMATGR